MQKQMDISQEDFNWLTLTYGKDKGYSYIDSKETVVHEIFVDKVLLSTNFLDYASYELSFNAGELHIKKHRLDNYKLHDKAKLIADEMDEDDEEELMLRWTNMMAELKLLEKLQGLSNARDPLVQLYLDIFDEDMAEEQISRLPEIVSPNVMKIWDELSLALENTGNIVEFEWQEFSTTGISALNQLAPLQTAGIELKSPTPAAYKEITAAEDFAKEMLDFVNDQLDEHELKVVAIGPVLDEYQAFTCLSVQDFRLANAVLKLEELCLVCFF
jgi:hypothetical protein